MGTLESLELLPQLSVLTGEERDAPSLGHEVLGHPLQRRSDAAACRYLIQRAVIVATPGAASNGASMNDEGGSHHFAASAMVFRGPTGDIHGGGRHHRFRGASPLAHVDR